MLVLGRREGEWIQVGNAKVFVLRNRHGRISLGIEAPHETKVLRGEVIEREKDEGKEGG